MAVSVQISITAISVESPQAEMPLSCCEGMLVVCLFCPNKDFVSKTNRVPCHVLCVFALDAFLAGLVVEMQMS